MISPRAFIGRTLVFLGFHLRKNPPSGGPFREVHGVTHAFELFDEPSLVGILLLALDEVVAAEFVIWLSTLQNMVGDYKDRMRDGDDGLVVSVTSFDPRILRCKIGALGSCRRLRGFDQRRSQPLRAFARFTRESLAGRL